MPSDLSITTICDNDQAFVDILFLHGLSGDPVETWTSSDSDDPLGGSWPAWLCDELQNARISSLGYPASVFEKWAKKEMGLFERSKSVLDLLEHHDFGDRPIVLVTHSLGGLLAKQILMTAMNSNAESWKAIATSVKLVVYLATPHSGASLARTLNFLFPHLSSPHIEALTNESGQLQELNDAYRAFAVDNEIKTIAYYEKFKSKGAAIVVDSASADPGTPGTTAIPVDADHETICKPHSRNDPVYLGVRKHIAKLIESLEIKSSNRVDSSESDRRDLLQKLIDANREHEYRSANDLQNQYSRERYRLGLHTSAHRASDRLLSAVEQRFLTHVYQTKICTGGSDEEIADALQMKVIDPVVNRFQDDGVDEMKVVQAIYYLTEQCFISWNPI